MRRVLFVLFSCFYLTTVYAQPKVAPSQRKSIEEMMKMQDELLQSLMDDSSFSQMEKRMQERMEEMMKRFDDDSFFSQSFRFNNPIVGEYNWTEDEAHRYLSLKVTQIKDRPLDIKIENGQIKIKGEVQEVDQKNKKQISKVQFERVFSIPQDVDATKPTFNNKEGELVISFPKLKNNKSITPSKKLEQNRHENENEERIPLEKQDGDVSI